MADPAAPRPASVPSRRDAFDWQQAWRSPSVLVLIAANLLPLYGVLRLDWPVLPVVVLFWLENIIIGLLNMARMALAGPASLADRTAKLLLIPFFAVHYGLFTAVHGLFVFTLFGGESYRNLVDGLWTVPAARQAIGEFALWLPLAALAASHLFSLLWNYLGKGEFRNTRLMTLMHAPYGRIVVLHLTLLGGGFLVQMLGSPLPGLLLLIVLKIGFDVHAHLAEHRALGVASGPTDT